MQTVTESTQDNKGKFVTAIAIDPRSQVAWSDEPRQYRPVAWFIAGEKDEVKADISRDEYDALRASMSEDDYRDGDYISFSRPIEWRDVFPERMP